MIVFTWVFQYVGVVVIVAVGFVLDRVAPPTVMIAGFPIEIVCVRIAAVGRQDIVEIEDEDVAVLVVSEPVVCEPLVEGASIARKSWIAKWWSRDDNE